MTCLINRWQLQGIQLIAPHLKNRVGLQTQGGRTLGPLPRWDDGGLGYLTNKYAQTLIRRGRCHERFHRICSSCPSHDLDAQTAAEMSFTLDSAPNDD